ncbi:twin-arginine translocase TatA/TatE family subunit [Pedobacter agri]|nr:twin-arginine translocase TatA/TatE family subunit [Pedobacter agri]
MSAVEIILIGVVILLIFGGKKLPELMRGIGKSVKEFKDAKDEPSK